MVSVLEMLRLAADKTILLVRTNLSGSVLRRPSVPMIDWSGLEFFLRIKGANILLSH